MSARTGRPSTGRKPNFSIRIDPDALNQARSAAVTQKKTLGQWLEEAIVEKIEREHKRKGGDR
jgi:predicted HicB family RNase H-like nuclease